MTTLIINIDEESTLKTLLKLIKKLHLKAQVMNADKNKSDEEREDWMNFSAQHLNNAYGENEPSYDLSMVKEPNPEYKP